MSASAISRQLTTRQLAEALGYSHDDFRRRILPGLQADGFPERGAVAPGRWDEQQVIDWQRRRRRGEMSLSQAYQEVANDREIDWDAELARRGKAIADGLKPAAAQQEISARSYRATAGVTR